MSLTMPPLETVTFIIGAALIVIGILGGGIEVKEIKVPRIAGPARLAAVVIGGLFVVIGTFEHDPQPAPKREGSEVVRPVDAPKRSPAAGGEVRVKEDSGLQAQLASRERAEEADRLKTAQLQGRVIQALTGTFRLDWKLGDELYQSTLIMDGGSGRMRTFVYERGVLRNSVDQDMALRFSPGTIYLVGSNPVLAGTHTPHPSYSPDNLLLRQINGSVMMLMCDRALNCTSAVSMRKSESSR